MFCTHCGKEIADDSIFCGFCGKSLSKNKEIRDKNINGNPLLKIIGIFLASCVIIFFVTLFISVFTLRHHNSIQNKGLKEDYIPVSIGNIWKYKVEEYLINKVSNITDKVISCDKNQSGLTYTLGDSEHSNNFVKKTTGLFSISKDNETGEINEFCQLAFPIKEGQTWKAGPDNIVYGLSSSGEIVATDLQVEVPAGTFKNCIKVVITYKSPAGNIYTASWYAPNIGLIQTTAEGVKGLAYKKSLTYFKVGNKESK